MVTHDATNLPCRRAGTIERSRPSCFFFSCSSFTFGSQTDACASRCSLTKLGRICALTVATLLLVAQLASADIASAAAAAEKLEPMLREHCYECHGPDLQEGELDFAE